MAGQAGTDSSVLQCLTLFYLLVSCIALAARTEARWPSRQDLDINLGNDGGSASALAAAVAEEEAVAEETPPPGLGPAMPLARPTAATTPAQPARPIGGSSESRFLPTALWSRFPFLFF